MLMQMLLMLFCATYINVYCCLELCLSFQGLVDGGFIVGLLYVNAHKHTFSC